MKSFSPIGLKYLVVLVIFCSTISVHGQATRTMIPPFLQVEKAKSLFNSKQFDAAGSYISSITSSASASALFSAWDLAELQYIELISGVILHQQPMIRRAQELMSAAGDRNTQVKLAYHLGHHYFSTSDFNRSLEFLEQTDPLYLSNDENERVQFEKGISYFSQQKFDNAKPYLRSIEQLGTSPYLVDVRYYLGFIAFSEKKYEEAGSYFKLIESAPAYINIIPFYQACIALSTGNFSKAITYGEKYLKSGDQLHVQAITLLLASAYHNTGDFVKSVSLFNMAKGQGLELSEVQHFELGSAYYATGQFAKAIAELKPLSASNGQLAAKSMLLLGNSYLQSGQKANARSAFQICTSTLEEGPQLDNVRFQLAKLSLELGFEDMAVQELNKIILEQRQSVHVNEARAILVDYYAKTNNYRQALMLIQDGKVDQLTMQKVAPRIYFGRGVELINDLQYDDADKLLSAVASYKNSPFYPPSLFWRGEIASRKDQVSPVIKFTQDYLKVRQNDFGQANEDNANYNLGYAYLDQEDYKSAVTYFEKIIQSKALISNDFRREAVLRAADCAFMLKNVERARTLYQSMRDKPGYGSDYAYFQTALIEGSKSADKKIDQLRILESRFPQSELMPLVTMELADTYMSEEQYDKSIPYLKRIPSLVDKDDDRMPESFIKLAIAYYNLNKPEESISYYKKLIDQYPASEYAQEALESAKSLFVETGRISDYESFLASTGRSVDQLQKDSLTFQYVQTIYAEGNNVASLKVLDDYLKSFPDGLFIADVLNYKGEMLLKSKDWKNAAILFEQLGAKGVSKYQEKALRQSGKLYFFELKDYESALRVFLQLSAISSNPEAVLEALRGTVRSYYYQKKWIDGKSSANSLIGNVVSTADDKSFANMILGYADQLSGALMQSSVYFKAVISNSNSALAAESRFQLAMNQFLLGNYTESENLATTAIEKSGSYEYWITKSYILLGQIFLEQKDYFNAKATLKSVVDNCTILTLKQEAIELLSKVEKTENNAISK